LRLTGVGPDLRPSGPRRCVARLRESSLIAVDTASSAPEVLKVVVRANQNNAGIYGAVTRIGRLAVGQTVFLGAAKVGKAIGSRRGF
jgi:hypothetical protein